MTYLILHKPTQFPFLVDFQLKTIYMYVVTCMPSGIMYAYWYQKNLIVESFYASFDIHASPYFKRTSVYLWYITFWYLFARGPMLTYPNAHANGFLRFDLQEIGSSLESLKTAEPWKKQGFLRLGDDFTFWVFFNLRNRRDLSLRNHYLEMTRSIEWPRELILSRPDEFAPI